MQFDGCGVLATVRSRDPAGAVDRLETLLAQSRPQLSATALHRQLAAAVNIVVQTEYTATGEPRVIAMLSVNWLDGEFRLNDMLPKQRVH
jgi:Flp pilus assembly CpaF family ATPase